MYISAATIVSSVNSLKDETRIIKLVIRELFQNFKEHAKFCQLYNVFQIAKNC